ncbi:putative peptide modification system cyclase [Stenotrophomonas rhizophila]|jgi:putative peptide modification system cyclase|uniref:Peptide modification system cyclase n=1 Tax=Stenotrophomonas nematodicola TaxID=2656746 RepID=A0ABW7CWB3_9GAMM
MYGDIGTSTQAPQMRALLFTDLCDSLILVERIGDTAAAELFQQHDRLVLTLQQQWNGHQIDRSDGLFLLFERAIDALGFALDYQRGLKRLGEERGIVLRARAGLHVGEVLTWENSPEAIRVGAKSLEVEGLAKPMAARLMALARPGQILMSAVAESLTHRASGELGDRATRLLWKSHGRWRFKGVPTRQEVFEVGEIGFAPLRMPSGNAKARRDIPLWRQPAALVAELAVMAMLMAGGWMLLRPAPAIAFAERDWVVIGDLRNLTDNPILDDTLDQAFRISLEQSRHVNVVSQDRIERTLQMMRKGVGGGALDRSNAAVVALRTGANLVLMPAVTDVGGRVRFSVEVMDPRTQHTLAVSTSFADRGAVLAAVDKVSLELRDELGEEAAMIQRDAMPLPEVTTANMDALRAFALGQKRYLKGDYRAALGFYQQATEIDGDFALAWLGQARCHFAQVDFGSAADALRRAQALTAHLPTREAMYVKNWTLQVFDPDRAGDGWLRMSELYPDYVPAANNAAMNLYNENRFLDALPLAKRVAESTVDLHSIGLDQYGRILLALGRYDDADAALGKAVSIGWNGALMRQASVAAARRDFSRAGTLLDALDAANYHGDLVKTTVALDRGDVAGALRHAERGLAGSRDKPGADQLNYHVPLAVAYMQSGQRQRALALTHDAVTRAFAGIDSAPSVDAIDRVVSALAAGIVARRLGDGSLAKTLPERIAALKNLPKSRVVDEFSAVLQAEQQRVQGKPREALQTLAPFISPESRVQTRVAAMHAARDAGMEKIAAQHAGWLQQRAGMAYAEIECSFCLQALNILDVRAVTGQRPTGAGPTRVSAP